MLSFTPLRVVLWSLWMAFLILGMLLQDQLYPVPGYVQRQKSTNGCQFLPREWCSFSLQHYSFLNTMNSQRDPRSIVVNCWFYPLTSRLGLFQSVRPTIFIGSIGVRLIIPAFPLVFDHIIMVLICSIIFHRKGNPIWTQPAKDAFSSSEWNCQWPGAKRSSPSSERPWRRFEDKF
jgi:hypothetical protein